MAVNSVQYYAASVTFNSVTYDKTSGGPLEVTEAENPNVMSDKTGDAVYPTFTKAVGYQPTVFVKMRDIESVPTRGASSSLEVVYTEASGQRKRTYATMIYVGKDASLVHAAPGETVLRFDHQSADGTSEWFSDGAVGG